MSIFLVPIALSLAAATESPAAPTFVSDHPGDVMIAEKAFEAARDCTGRMPAIHREVQIVRRTIPGDFLGIAHTDERGLYRIDLDAGDTRRAEVLVHEVAHAWVSKGAPALVEGTTELLADCIVRAVPQLAPLPADDGRHLHAMPDLRVWLDEADHGPALPMSLRTDAYLGAARLARTLAMVTDPTDLWSGEKLSWSRIEALLSDGDKQGAELWEAVSGGSEAQQLALSDSDLDGIPHLAESWLGTDPTRFDTDADGAWDGALAQPEGSVVLPLDGTPVCSGFEVSKRSDVHVIAGGNLRGTRPPSALVRDPRDGSSWDPPPPTGWLPSQGATADPGIPLLLQLHGTISGVSGGLWATLEGPHLVESAACDHGEGHTVFVTDPELAVVVQPFVDDLLVSIARAEERFGAAPGRIAVGLGGSRTTIENSVVWFDSNEVKRAAMKGELADLSRLAVGLRQAWLVGERDWSAGVGLGNSLKPDPVD